jgi:hypothetical protein
MPECAQRQVEPREAVRHLRTIAADTDEMDSNAAAQQCGIDSVFHAGPRLAATSVEGAPSSSSQLTAF